MLKLKSLNYQIGAFQEHELTPEEWIIGRAATCDLVLASPEVSRIHSRIEYIQGQYYFSDLGSTDGSRINHEQTEINQKYLLKPDDIIRIGDFILAIESISASEPETLNYQTQTEQWTGNLTVRCVRIIPETEDVKTFRFVAEPPRLFTYQPGQFVTLKLEIDGNPVHRAYSISSSPSRPHSLDITVKRVPPPADAPEVPPGVVSNWLHDNLSVGSKIQLSGAPMGHFTCSTNAADKLLMISAGSGITPMLSMARWLTDTGQDREVVFCHSARSPRDIIARSELELMAAQQPHFRLAMTVTRPNGQPWLGYTGRLTEAMLLNMVPDWRDRTVYVCGPASFMQGVKTIFSNLDFSMENYHEESFGGAKKQQKPAPQISAPQTSSAPAQAKASPSTKPIIVFSEAEKEISCGETESILEIAQQNEVNIRSGCFQGVCGACKKRKQEGEVRYEAEPTALDEKEQKEGYILPCVAYPVGKVVIEA